ncbi:MAG TPA: diguanylate cyclase [Anaerolineales bacterium]|nr:diguanylate cyclase [Anaerolineales bacterium]
MQYHPYAIYLFISALITFVASLITWRRSAPGAFTLGLLLLSITIWSVSDAGQLIQGAREAKIFWLNIMIIGAVCAPVLFLIFTLNFTHNETWRTPRSLLLLFLPPAAFIILLWTNEIHHLYFRSIETVEANGLILLELIRGPGFFVNVSYSYTIIALGLLVLLHASFRSGPLFRNQYHLILLGCFLPWALGLYSQYRFESLNMFEITPITFGVTGMIFVFAILRTDFMNLIPVARSRLIENMRDGVLVLDSQNRIVDINPSMEKILGEDSSPYLGRDASEILNTWMETADALLNGLETQTEMRLPHDPTRFLDLRVTPLHDIDQRLNGRLIVFRDITERKDVEWKLRNANHRLQSQLIEIGILQSQLREQAIRDPLTDLFNRRYLEETLDRELARAAREKYPVCLIMIDIDHFKQVNDTHGHEAGDLVLKALADILAQQSRKGDFACRYGGEEFMVVMPNINNSMAYERAESLRASIHSLHVPFGIHDLTITISMGIACYPENGDTRDSIIRAADQAMYAAKDAGRDHIRSYDQIEAANE